MYVVSDLTKRARADLISSLLSFSEDRKRSEPFIPNHGTESYLHHDHLPGFHETHRPLAKEEYVVGFFPVSTKLVFREYWI